MNYNLKYFLLLLAFELFSCGSKYEKFDSYYVENTEDTIHVYCLDKSSFEVCKGCLWQMDYYKLPDSVLNIKDEVFNGKKISRGIANFFRLDSLIKTEVSNWVIDIENVKFYGVYKIHISNNFSGYITRCFQSGDNPFYFIVEFIYDQKKNKISEVIELASIGKNMSEDFDCNSWIFDYNKDGFPDVLCKESGYEYGEMDNLHFANKRLSSKEIIQKTRQDSAWVYLWRSNKYEVVPLNFNKVSKSFEYKMIEYYKGYRGCYWFD